MYDCKFHGKQIIFGQTGSGKTTFMQKNSKKATCLEK